MLLSYSAAWKPAYAVMHETTPSNTAVMTSMCLPNQMRPMRWSMSLAVVVESVMLT